MKRAICFFVLFVGVMASAQDAQTKTVEKKTVETKTETKQVVTKSSDATTMAVLDGGIGPCSAEFHVVGMDGKPVYEAKVHTLIKYGAFGVKKLDLQVSTNIDGKAKFTGLPDVNKRPIAFEITKDGKRTVQAYEPGASCHPTYEITLGKDFVMDKDK